MTRDSTLAVIVVSLLLAKNGATAFTTTTKSYHHQTRSALPTTTSPTATSTTSTRRKNDDNILSQGRSLLLMQPNNHFHESSAASASSSSSPAASSSLDEISAYVSSSNTLRHRRDQQQLLRAIAIGRSWSDETVQDGDGIDDNSAVSFYETNVASSSLSLSEDAQDSNMSSSSMWQVLSAASLVTGSTVGAGMLILPSLAAGPGFAISAGMFLAIYLMVLTSGLIIADVAINQHESGYDVPSSFQEFAEANLDSSDIIAKCVSAVPVAVNSLMLVFSISKAGDLGSSLLSPFFGMDPALASIGFVGILGACLSLLSSEKLSAVASMCVSALLLAFGGLLLPGLAAVQDPMGTLLVPGLDGDQWLGSVVAAAPIVLTSLQFQNVVPSLTKILQYDRQKTVAAIALGSFTPLAMYLAWCFAVLGGGIDFGRVAGPLMTVFTAATLFGSSIGASMSVTEEVQTFVSKNKVTEEGSVTKKSDTFSLPAVLLSLAVPMAGVMAFSGGNGDASAALAIAGSFGSPILYGIIPAMMAINQRRKSENTTGETAPSLVPGGLASVGALGTAATMYVGQGFAQHLTGALSVAS